MSTHKKNRSKQKKKDIDLKKAKILIALFVITVPIFFVLFIAITLLSYSPKTTLPFCDGLSPQPTHTWNIPVTAYSSTVDQTDSTPFITANGFHVEWGVVATNFLPFHTCIKFPELFGDQFFVVHDRKHERFSESIDIWYPSRAQAKSFGKKTLKTQIWD
jgi:3D (Asp-Asp-Asp) domain-containing protein